MRKIFSGWVLLFLLTAAWCHGGDLVIFNTTDLHGRTERSSDLYAKLMAEKAKYPNNSIYLDCGDIFQGTFLASESKGENQLDFLATSGCRAINPGNHDFEYGITQLLKLQRLFAGDLLAANIESSLIEFAPFKIYQVSDWRIAVIGLAENAIDRRILHGDKLKIIPDADALGKVMPEVLAQKPDLIILLRHGGRYGKIRLADILRKFPQIDLVLGGHTHELAPGEKIGESFFVQAGKHAESFLKITAKRTPKNELFIESETIKCLPSHEKFPLLPIVARLPNPLSQPREGEINSPFSQLATSAMREYTRADAAIYLTMAGDKNYPVELTAHTLYNMFPYEDQVVTVKVDVAHYQRLVNFLQDKVKGSRSAMGFSPLDNHDGKITVAMTAYTLAGAGNVLPEIKEIIDVQKMTVGKFPLPMRKIVEQYLQKINSDKAKIVKF